MKKSFTTVKYLFWCNCVCYRSSSVCNVGAPYSGDWNFVLTAAV